MVTEEQVASTQAIGARFEGISATLDAAGQVLEHLRSLEGLLSEVRQPFAEEFQAHKADHAELIALRAAFDQAVSRLSATEDREQALLTRVHAAEAGLQDATSALHANATLLEQGALEIDTLRLAVTHAENRAAETNSALEETLVRIGQLEQDNFGLREQVMEADERRREADALLSRASQQTALQEEELNTLRARLERAAGEVARLSRIETDLTAQLSTERARTMSVEAAAGLAQAEAGRMIQGLEEQLAARRWEVEGLQSRLETSLAQVNRLNELNTELSRRLEEANTHARLSERRTSDLQTASGRSEERLRFLETELAAQRSTNLGLEAARATAIERAQQLGKSLQAQEVALRRAEEKETALRTSFERLQSAHAEFRRNHETQVAELQRKLEQQQADSAIAEGALESARRDRARLQVALLGKGEPHAASSAGA